MFVAKGIPIFATIKSSKQPACKENYENLLLNVTEKQRLRTAYVMKLKIERDPGKVNELNYYTFVLYMLQDITSKLEQFQNCNLFDVILGFNDSSFLSSACLTSSLQAFPHYQVSTTCNFRERKQENQELQSKAGFVLPLVKSLLISRFCKKKKTHRNFRRR